MQGFQRGNHQNKNMGWSSQPLPVAAIIFLVGFLNFVFVFGISAVRRRRKQEPLED
jgi:hypothetical protein